jgi:hypothetical protein
LIVMEQPSPWSWVLYADTSTGCDLIARSARAYPDPFTARAAAHALAGASPAQVWSVQDPDGSWQWCLYGADGSAAAVSAGRFTHARASYADIKRLLRVLRRVPLQVGLRRSGGAAGRVRFPGEGSGQAETVRTGAGSA